MKFFKSLIDNSPISQITRYIKSIFSNDAHSIVSERGWKVLNKKSKFKVSEVIYFSPRGNNAAPNGHPFYNGGFIKECQDNRNKFKPNDTNCVGGIIILPEKQNLNVTSNNVVNSLSKQIALEDYTNLFSIGNYFFGKYIDGNDSFNENSISIQINGLSSKGLIEISKELVDELDQEKVLLKDLNSRKIYLVNKKR